MRQPVEKTGRIQVFQDDNSFPYRMLTMMLHQLFCDIDDFCQNHLATWKHSLLETGERKRQRSRCLCESEVMTIAVYFQMSGYRTFKWYYQKLVLVQLLGKLFGDRGYIFETLTQRLASQNVELITTVRKNMKPKVLVAVDKLLLRKRCIIETINNQLKNTFSLEHSRHRSLFNFLVNTLVALIAYSYQPKKPFTLGC